MKKILTTVIFILLSIGLSSCNNEKTNIVKEEKTFSSSNIRAVGGEALDNGSISIGTEYDKKNEAIKENAKDVLKTFSEENSGIDFNK